MGAEYWTDERVRALKAAKAYGYSLTEISFLPPFKDATRNAIAGKCHRLGLCKPDPRRKRLKRRA